MLYRHIIDYCFEEHLGRHGLTRSTVDARVRQLAGASKSLTARSNLAAKPLLDLPSQTSDLEEIEKLATHIRKRFRHVVVAGTGGSGLSGRTLTQLTLGASSVTFHFLENIDPDPMEALLARLDVEQSCFLVISKSGSTAETLGQFYVLLDHVGKKLGKKAVREHFFVITVPQESPMRESAKEYGLPVIDHARDIGGRFSILTVVGLLPAAIAGLDIRALRRGAQSVVSQLDKGDSAGCDPAIGAALQCAFIEKGYPLSVMLPYSERLSGFSSWYRQSWAESLGKQGRGSTPIRAVGTTDQHSQLQLYLDGPKDKLFHMIMLKRAGHGPRIETAARPDIAYLKGKTLGDVMAAEQKATFETLIRNRCPVRLLRLDRLGEEEMGALLMHFMLEIILTAELLEVNPFDQPAVEEGKQLARDFLMSGSL